MLCGRRKTVWGAGKTYRLEQNMSLCRKPRVVPVFSGVAVILWFLAYSTNARAAETSSSRIPRLAPAAAQKHFNQLRDSFAMEKVSPALAGRLVEAPPLASPVQPTTVPAGAVNPSGCSEISATNRHLACTRLKATRAGSYESPPRQVRWQRVIMPFPEGP
jgi:hypothetical protein